MISGVNAQVDYMAKKITQQQVRYDIENSDINQYPPKNSELQISGNCISNMRQMQMRNIIPIANTFVRNQKPKRGIKYFDKHILNR